MLVTTAHRSVVSAAQPTLPATRSNCVPLAMRSTGRLETKGFLGLAADGPRVALVSVRLPMSSYVQSRALRKSRLRL